MLRHAAALFLGVVLLTLAACGGGDDAPGDADASGDPTSGATEVTASPFDQPSPTIVGSPGEAPSDGTATPATVTPTTTSPAEPPATAEPATPTSTAIPPPEAGDLEGEPFSTADLRSAVVERDATFEATDGEPPCPQHTVLGQTYRAVMTDDASGPVVALWVYADSDALQADWDAVPGSAPESLAGCELPSGFVYWNENLVLALVGWVRDGEAGPLGAENPRNHPVVEAFLSLSR